MNIKRIPLAVLALVTACAAIAYLVGSFRPFSATDKFSRVETEQNTRTPEPPTVIALAPTIEPTERTSAVQATNPTANQPTPIPLPREPIQAARIEPTALPSRTVKYRVASTETALPSATRGIYFVAQSRPTATPTEFFSVTRIAQGTATPTVELLAPDEARAATWTSVPAQQTLAAISTRAFSTPTLNRADPERAINKTTNFLLIGTDSRTTDPNWVPNTDVMMVLFLDTAKQRAALFSLPRDLAVAIPGNHAFRINTAYNSGWATDGVEGGVSVLKQVLTNEFGVRIDHWALIDFDGLSEIIDVLGGIEVNVPCALSDTIDEQAFTIPAGIVQMDYLTSKRYVQSRYTTSDTSRNHRQQRVVWAMAKKALGLNAPDRVPLLYARLQQNIATDMSLFDMIGLIPAVYQLDLLNHPERLRARVLEAPAVYPWVSTSGAWLYMPNYEEIEKELDEIFDAPQVALDEASSAECPWRPATPVPTDVPPTPGGLQSTPTSESTPNVAATATAVPAEPASVTPAPAESFQSTVVPALQTATETPTMAQVPTEQATAEQPSQFPTFTPQSADSLPETATP
jgi:LCP family protein required for cell wall assembly